VETRATLKACIDARVALAELNMAARSIPNQAILVNTLAGLEACASAELDHFRTTIDQWFQHAGDDREPTDPGTRLALRYWTALQRGVDSLIQRPLSTATAVQVCRDISGLELDIRTLPAAAFTNQAGVALYTPPHGEALVRDLLTNWERYLHDQASIDPLIRLAVGCYQFEAIHPFSDGNGPTARILRQLYLVEQQLLELPILHLNRATIWKGADCYRQLNNVTRSGAWEPWILSHVNAVNEAARWTTAKILAMRGLLLETTRYIQRRAPSLYSRELVESVFAHPYCRIANLVQAGLAKRQTASRYLTQLCEIGILDDVKVGRDKLFIHLKLMALLKSEQHAFPHYDS